MNKEEYYLFVRTCDGSILRRVTDEEIEDFAIDESKVNLESIRRLTFRLSFGTSMTGNCLASLGLFQDIGRELNKKPRGIVAVLNTPVSLGNRVNREFNIPVDFCRLRFDKKYVPKSMKMVPSYFYY